MQCKNEMMRVSDGNRTRGLRIGGATLSAPELHSRKMKRKWYGEREGRTPKGTWARPGSKRLPSPAIGWSLQNTKCANGEGEGRTPKRFYLTQTRARCRRQLSAASPSIVHGMGGNRTLAGLASPPHSRREPCHSATIPSISRRFRRKVKESNLRATNRHALAERCLNHSANLPEYRTRDCACSRSRREGQTERPELELQQARPAPHEQPEPSAACAGNSRSIAV
jgi:hypothetical protein